MRCVQKAASALWIAHAGEPHPDFDPEAYRLYRANIGKPVYVKKVIPEALRWEVFERDGFSCKHCGARDHLRADHIIPERQGGEMTLENLQTLCRRCNSKKGGRQ
jgi:ribosomal protein L40E